MSEANSGYKNRTGCCCEDLMKVCYSIMDHMQEACALIETADSDPNAQVLVKSNAAYNLFFEDWDKSQPFILVEELEALNAKGDTQAISWRRSHRNRVGDGSLMRLSEKRYLLVFTDRTREREVELLKDGYRRLLEESQDIILFIASSGRIMDANAKAIATYGYSYEELTAMTVRQLRSDDTENVFHGQFKAALEKGIVFETMHRRKDGRIFPVEVSSKSAMVYDEPIVMSLVRDITHRKKEQEMLIEMATHDSLTGALNRAGLCDAFERCVHLHESGKSFAVFHMDINLFKSINDTYGHVAGDEVLKEFVRRLKSQTRSDDLVVRLGGDEFLLVQTCLVKEDHIREVASFVHRLMKVLEPTHDYEGEGIPIKASIGISIYPDDGTTLDELITAADKAMYTVKSKSSETRYCIYNRDSH